MSQVFTTRKFRIILALLFATVMLPACMQNLHMDIPRFADRSAMSVPEETLKTVNRAFYADFLMGDWHYQGAKAQSGDINAYILIPQKLQMPTAIQKKYLQQSICPKADKIDLWNELKDYSLRVHIYTHTKTQSVSAECKNPWQQA